MSSRTTRQPNAQATTTGPSSAMLAGTLRRAAIIPVAQAAPPSAHDVLREPGQPLDQRVRQALEPRFGHDFSRVRVHTDLRAAEAARAVDAAAYTAGRHVVFGAGQYAPETPAGRHLLAHELTHVVQQGTGSTATSAALGVAAPTSLAENEAQQQADTIVHGVGQASVQQRLSTMYVQRQPIVGWTDAPKGSLNKQEKKISKIRRIPLDRLAVGHQRPAPGAQAGSDRGQAVVLIHEQFDATKAADVLLFFHGKNTGYRQSSSILRDRDIYQIERQIEASGKPQLVGILPQGSSDAEFGVDSNKQKTFDVDAYLQAIFDALVANKIWAAIPSVGNVTLSGHSGAGELIDEKLLGGAAGSQLPSKFGTLKEVALFDAINGPHEFAAVKQWVKSQLDQNMTDLTARPKQQDQIDYLKSSMRFRAYFSETDNGYYTKWHVGPLNDPRTPDKEPLKDMIDAWFQTHEQSLGGSSSPVYQALRNNYRVIPVGHKEHDAVLAKGDRLKEALDLMP